MKCVSLKVMKETETTRNSCHIDPDHKIAADRIGAERRGGLHGSTSGIAQAPRWKYVFPDICKKTQKSFIGLLAPLKIYLFIWRRINSFYTRIHEVVGDRALLPVEEHINTSAPMPLSPAYGRLQSASVSPWTSNW